ncbi:class I SAM-dependent methyltransferase [Geoanaerobacter pelophilus]|nr:class I SAM-dependent methyltransferase [Geoanaerobacter pelophilus]
MREIGKVDYYKCKRCGFVLSRTHSKLDENRHIKLNGQFHHFLENLSEDEFFGNQPPYAEQAMMIAFLAKIGVISTDNIIDYAAGYGTLSTILAKYYNIDLPLFDPYVQSSNSNRYIAESKLKTYDTVINSAMFEHVLKREDLDRVNSLVNDNGVLIIHTVVCENVPCDPNWFYLRPPVHTAFHTNKSMEILMRQWGYRSSVYCPQSKCWILRKSNIEAIESKLVQLNNELQANWFYYKNSFVDYWKGF